MSAEIIAGDPQLLLLCDHASNAVPPDIDLGVAPQQMARHIAYDIGAGPLTRALAAATSARAVLGTVSRLVIDLHREPDHPGLIPLTSDGCDVAGNRDVDREARIARFFTPYHRAIGAEVRRVRPDLIIAIHSFTRRLEAGNAPERQWEAGILYNRDARAARPAIDFLRKEELITGDNEPYSGRHLNMTLNRHAEANGIPALSVEVCNDLIGDDAGVEKWCDILSRMTVDIRNRVAPERRFAT